ncbi:hypothetical protein AN957_09510 [Cytobacillus solani]|uniref:Transcription initiation factor TFIIIB n=1 Tax=Cytobacillus solani TaxID=1637975 RepID=A0A0Q3VGX2_9BACI|nr:hypothetical protein AMS60_04735 [Bacillus sp. FJAT-21945]KQL18786.1 hypothetical protein AN957_09510 [Cytobacillus solani]
MTNQVQTCKACGSTKFTKGRLDGYAKVRPINKTFSLGSNLILTFCKKCGEVSSMKVEKPNKF